MEGTFISQLWELLLRLVGAGGVVVIAIIHVILTFAVYKWKGGPMACFYFFLAPLAIAALVLFMGRGAGGVNSNR